MERAINKVSFFIPTLSEAFTVDAIIRQDAWLIFLASRMVSSCDIRSSVHSKTLPDDLASVNPVVLITGISDSPSGER